MAKGWKHMDFEKLLGQVQLGTNFSVAEYAEVSWKDLYARVCRNDW